MVTKSLVSGSNGFLAKHLIEALKERGHKVTNLPRELFAKPEELKEFIEEVSPDQIYHLAAYGNHSSQNDIDQMIAANVFNLYLLLRQSQNIPYKVFVNISTSSVNLPYQTFYSATKSAGEKITTAFQNVLGKPIINCRPASIYGEGEAEFRFIPTVIKHLKSGRKMDLVVEPTHSWMYVDDFVEALILCATRSSDIKVPINISNGALASNGEIVKILEDISGKKLKYNMVGSLREYDTDEWLVGNYELKHLGYKQKYSLLEGLKKTYESTK